MDSGGMVSPTEVDITPRINRAFALARAFGSSSADIRRALVAAVAAETSEPLPILSSGAI